jgi:GT2 family glycosyltransferase
MSSIGTTPPSPPRPTLSVIIVNWNAGEALKQCVDAVLSSTQTAFHLGVRPRNIRVGQSWLLRN